MKISISDRREALSRNPAYLMDLKKWEYAAEQIRAAQLRSQIPGIELTTATKTFLELDKEIRERWSILHFADPVYDQAIYTDEVAVTPIGLSSGRDGKMSFNKMAEGDDPLEFRIAYQKDEKGVNEFKNVHEKGRHIYLRIDLTKTDDEIEKRVKTVVGAYKKLLPKKRNKEGSMDHWEIYNKVHKEGLSLSQIAQQEHKGEASFDDAGYKAFYACVERAYKKAQQIIKQVNE